MKKQKQESLTDEQLFVSARQAALRVDFIQTVDELRLYTCALYTAMLWGKHTSDRNPSW
ncbi:MAG: hypothetical protein LUF04_07835 [Bacteroides sp.]|nr:hypothetical protein [Bacteroides sp.]